MPYRRIPAEDKKQAVPALALAALGIVFGDIGTSPLYALKACFSGFHSIPATSFNVLGVLSLVFWSLTMVISFKYVAFVMRADNRGEGGVFALFSLLPLENRRFKGLIIVAALFGAALLYGDGFITPAISVLSALEGVSRITPDAEPFIVHLTCAVLLVLFLVQCHGTDRIGKVFGPIMLLWFAVIAVLGVVEIAGNPGVLRAVNPLQAVSFLFGNPGEALTVLGAVVLCVTGAEALYADMGHFGARPIRLAWYFVAMPALLLNYFGQGALLLRDPDAVASPFYGLVPPALVLPMVVLATCATVIASQAVISGVFSITRQAIQLGYLPRLHIVHTSRETEGQIFCPEANLVMAAVCLLLVVVFRSSDGLAGAYGIAITATMVVTTGLYLVYLVRVRNWNTFAASVLCLFFLIFDSAFFGANLLKIMGGGWIPLAVAGFVILCMQVWAKGRRTLKEKLAPRRLKVEEFLEYIKARKTIRTPGTSVFLTYSPRDIPPVLMHALTLQNTLTRNVVLLTYITEPVPRTDTEGRAVIKVLGDGVYRLVVRIGFSEMPNAAVDMLRLSGTVATVSSDEAVYYMGREVLIVDQPRRLWKSFFLFMTRNAMRSSLYFKVPPDRVIELGLHLKL